MKDILNVVLVQYDIRWHNVRENFAIIENMLSDINGNVDLIVLPETFCCGFTNSPEKLGDINSIVEEWMKQLSTNYNATIMGSFPFLATGKYYNRLLTVHANGGTESYDKNHLFSFSGENNHYAPGTTHEMISIGGWTISPAICYDIRFPVWCRNAIGYDLFVAVANWPAARNEAWEALLVARAIENQSYVIGVNRIGEDGRGTDYIGNSVVFSPEGKLLGDCEKNTVGLIQVSLSHEYLTNFRAKFPFLKDRDEFELL